MASMSVHDRLAVGNDCERFPRARRQAQVVAGMLETHEPAMVLRVRVQLETAGYFVYLKGAAVLLVQGVQFANKAAGLVGVG